jgi:hypothetical protein
VRFGLLEDGVESFRLLLLKERSLSREAMASPSSLGRGTLGDVL